MIANSRTNKSYNTLFDFNNFKLKKFIILFSVTFAVVLLLSSSFLGVEVRAAGISLDITPEQGTEEGALGTLEVLFLLVIVSLLPSILLSMTSFTRIVIALSFVRNALGLQQTPPNQVLIGIALFLSLFVMAPTFKK